MVVVVDTSVIVDHLSGRASKHFVDALDHEYLYVPPIVVAEIVTGATGTDVMLAVGELLQDAPVYEPDLLHWIAVGELRRNLAQHGLNVTIPDAHVAQCAIDLGATLLTRDEVFRRIAAHVTLDVAE